MTRIFTSLIATAVFSTLAAAEPEPVPTTSGLGDDDLIKDDTREQTTEDGAASNEPSTPPPAELPSLSDEQIEERILNLAERQDELSAIIQDLTWKWADKEIVKFLEEVDFALLDARDALDDQKLGGETIAAQNDAIEKIYQAAKKNQQDSGSQSDSLGAMMDQLDYMTGKKSSKSGKGKPGKEGQEAGDQPGQGGGNGAEDDGIARAGVAEKSLLESRTIPKAAGRTPTSIPSEFREGMEALRDDLANLSE